MTRLEDDVLELIEARRQPDRLDDLAEVAEERGRPYGSVLDDDGIVDEIAIARAVENIATPVALTRREREQVVRRLARVGLTDQGIADRCGVTRETIRRDRKRLGVDAGEPPRQRRVVAARAGVGA